MYRLLLSLLLPVLLLTCGPAPEDNIPPDVPQLSTLPLLPLPAEITDGEGVSYYKTYAGDMTPSSDATIGDAQRYLQQRMPGLILPLQYRTSERLAEGAYRIDFADGEIEIQASDRDGMLNAVKTLAQVLHFSGADAGAVYISEGEISDTPRYAYRGFMLDVARHFFNPEEVKQVVDRIAAYKINHLHLHLSDDQGWRIEIKGYPRLTEVGAATEVDGTPGGFYTQAEYSDLVDYAQQRGITVIPEIDMPGHTNAALSAYPILNVDGEEVQPYTGTNVGFSTFDVDQDSVYVFINDVVEQLAALTPGPYIHLGGDESDATDHEDYVRFIDEVQQIVQQHGKTAIGWDEVATSKLAPGTVVQLWAHPEYALQAKEAGNPVLMSPATRTYLDMQYDSTSRIGLHWAAYIEVDSAYLWDPATLAPGISDGDILGIEAPLWSETVRTLEDIDYLTFPRLLALAEVGWTPQDRREWEDFKRRLRAQVEWLEAQGVGVYASRVLE
ncbi:Beta-N-acetylhexosaminidase [Neolewinella maritima]|uniref:beta-N-acetylhexosaminidase n=1 Tax=Neolewinella maritima TaxID=1383882 RepID=A0ABM9AXU2_9BACT|nr:family 20 glycosylhydrolase [Neolewinella maritima]CAH0999321.1 Beta-N-acetylhexosaminidase [Neolewinella maritima]